MQIIHVDHRTCLQLSNYMTSRRTHHESTLTLQLTDSIQSTCLQLTVKPSLSRAHRTPSSASTNWMHTSPMQAQISSHKKINCSSRLQHLTSTWSPTSHNTSPQREVAPALREVPISFSRTQIASYRLHHQMWLRLCGCLRTLPKGSSHP